MANPENPNDDQAKVPVAELQQNAKQATPIYFTLLIYISVLILGVLVAIALIDNPQDRPDETGPAASENPALTEPGNSTAMQQNNTASVSIVPESALGTVFDS
jgi:cytoskeletal protein RodZ